MTCLNCPNRKIGCHTDCKAYAAYKAQLEKIKDNRKLEYAKDIPTIERCIKRKDNGQSIEKRRRGY